MSKASRKRAERMKAAREQVEGLKRVSPPGDPNDYIHHIDDLKREGQVSSALMRGRVSSRKQERSGQLDDQEANLRQEMADRNIKVSFWVDFDVLSGWDLESADYRRTIARAKKYDLVIVAESTDRFLRHRDYHSNRMSLPTVEQFERLKELTGGVTLATVLPPDATRAQVEAYQKKRGQRAKGNKGGCPIVPPEGYKKKRRVELKPLVLELHRKGYTLEQIKALTGIATSTAHRWKPR